MIWEDIQAKIKTFSEAASSVQKWQAESEKIVFTNGCFDLLHYGHLAYLAEAQSLGDRLIIGLNSEASVRRLKGKHRPINDTQTRTSMLAALAFVDAVVVFEADTPLLLIQHLSPDLLVKGGDWRMDQIVGSDWVIGKGGDVRSLQFVEGYSTTNIEQKIIELNINR